MGVKPVSNIPNISLSLWTLDDFWKAADLVFSPGNSRRRNLHADTNVWTSVVLQHKPPLNQRSELMSSEKLVWTSLSTGVPGCVFPWQAGELFFFQVMSPSYLLGLCLTGESEPAVTLCLWCSWGPLPPHLWWENGFHILQLPTLVFQALSECTAFKSLLVTPSQHWVQLSHGDFFSS